MSAAVEIGRRELVAWKVAHRTERNFDIIAVFTDEGTEVDILDTEWKIDETFRVSRPVVEAIQLVLREGDERCPLLGIELHLFI